MAYVVVAVAFFALLAFAGREILRRRLIRPIRESQEGSPVSFQTPILVKRATAPRWALGSRVFNLVVSPKVVAVLGPIGLQSWYLSAPQSTVELDRSGKTEWLILSGPEAGKPMEIWLRPTESGQLWGTWSALVSEGVEPLTEPPMLG
jgi:hypothetical protein